MRQSALSLPVRGALALSSLNLTLTALVLLAAFIVTAYVNEQIPSTALSFPLGLLSLNLLAAIITNRSFRRQTALLVFHLALLALLLLLAASRLTYLKGKVELAEGEEFSGALIDRDAGLLHPGALERLHFVNLGFHIDYAPGLQRQGIRNMLEVRNEQALPLRVEITDQKPLILSGYRFYPTSNKGFAPTFLWQPATGGEPTVGAVHLPSYPIHEHGQAREWSPPGTALRIWTMLEFEEVILDPDQPSQFRLPKQHGVIIRIGERRWELKPGEAIDLPQGRLVYQELRSWMGYSVFYDWTIPWLLAACLVAVGALGVHFRSKFAAAPWNEK